jgi:3-methyladenine DNA glycosylase Tag
MDGSPPRRRPKDLAGYLEALSRPVFQAGMSWRVIDAKWDGIRDAFAEFEPTLVAEYGQDDVERLLGDPRVVRSKAKIEATIDNAQTLLELDEQYGGFARYLRSHSSFEETVTSGSSPASGTARRASITSLRCVRKGSTSSWARCSDQMA